MKAPLKVPPKRWRNSRSLAALAGAVRVAAAASEDGAYAQIDLKLADSVVEALCQAIHTERGHEPRE